MRELMPCFAGDGTELQACVLDHLRTQMADLDSRIADLTQARTALGDILEASTRALALTGLTRPALGRPPTAQRLA
ncbi:hypothetical protein AB0L00_05415 [Actinoallomurus sp. NPDC052308]|uniref:hypothetical protein n=1 Tax=Actinoallomurus sp. NPDC052308 TaxID=3155530 RepID=UPI00341A89BF